MNTLWLVTGGVLFVITMGMLLRKHPDSTTSGTKKTSWIWYLLPVGLVIGLVTYWAVPDWVTMPSLTRETIFSGMAILAVGFFAAVMLFTKWGRDIIIGTTFLVGGVLCVVMIIVLIFWPEDLGLKKKPELSGYMGGYHTLEYEKPLEVIQAPGERRHFDERIEDSSCIMFMVDDWTQIQSWYQEGHIDDGNTYVVHNVSDQPVRVTYMKVKYDDVWRGVLCQ